MQRVEGHGSKAGRGGTGPTCLCERIIVIESDTRRKKVNEERMKGCKNNGRKERRRRKERNFGRKILLSPKMHYASCLFALSGA